jgi:hypothetical protein
VTYRVTSLRCERCGREQARHGLDVTASGDLVCWRCHSARLRYDGGPSPTRVVWRIIAIAVAITIALALVILGMVGYLLRGC